MKKENNLKICNFLKFNKFQKMNNCNNPPQSSTSNLVPQQTSLSKSDNPRRPITFLRGTLTKVSILTLSPNEWHFLTPSVKPELRVNTPGHGPDLHSAPTLQHNPDLPLHTPRATAP